MSERDIGSDDGAGAIMSPIRVRARTLISQLEHIARFAAFGLLCLLAGFITALNQTFPYAFLYNATMEIRDLLHPISRYESELYVRADSPRSGVTRYDPELAYNGYTIFTSAHTQGAFLIDMKGRIVHKWALPFSRVWNRHAAVSHPLMDSVIWDRAYLYPNGDVLAVYAAWGPKLSGYGLVKMDRFSHPIWTYLQNVHHDVTVGPDGRIYTLTMRVLPETRVLDNSVVVLSPEGKVLRKVSVLNALRRSKFRGLLALYRDIKTDDPLHVNSVVPMPPMFHRTFPFAGPNTVLISMRQLDTIALLDLDSRKIVWVLHGPFARQHDAEFLPNGDMTVFDDVGDAANGRHSRVLEFQPDPFKILWQFPGNSGEKLDSEIIGSAQKLMNGNVLICEGDNGRILEVTPDNKVVWGYRNPFRQGDKHQFVPIIRWARRFAPDQLHFKLDTQ